MPGSQTEEACVVLCNGATPVGRRKDKVSRDITVLEYRHLRAQRPNVRIELPDFVRGLWHVTPRILDLLEISAYVFAADRYSSRGPIDALEYHNWARSFHFVIKVRDFEFWNNRQTKNALGEALTFMTGDCSYLFTFQRGHSTPQADLFDTEEFHVDRSEETNVLLFSGGLDSLTGVVDQLVSLSSKLCLISHRSGQPGTGRTQKQLVSALSNRFPNRIRYYTFHCGLKGARAPEETQRTRSFLYSSIAYALCEAYGKREFYIYENGVTAINFARRQDLMNARASRTTHPKTIKLMERFFSILSGSDFKIHTPFLWKTKTDVVEILKKRDHANLLSSSVSCSRTFQNLGQATHCGGCYQCIDRRFSCFGADVHDVDDEGLYASDFVHHQIDDGEVKTRVVDYVRQARDFATWNIGHFHDSLLNELAEAVDFVGCSNEEEAVTTVFELCRRHGEQVLNAIKRMRDLYDDPYHPLPKGSLLYMLSEREYLKEPTLRLAVAISQRLMGAIPLAFQTERPQDENQLNDCVSAILDSDKDRLEREHPAVSFATAKAIPDHSWDKYQLLIESKYIRGSTTASAATEGLAADLTKYPKDSYKLFVVYDPERKISSDIQFRGDFERQGNCLVCIIR